MATVPSQYQAIVTKTAKTLGIPESVVAEQIQLESSWNPNAKSSAGAEGIAQFEPGTFAEYGSGSPYNVADAFAAYTKYMASLLKDEKGSIKKALEAYNAGPGNLQAGNGYATTILTRAGVDEAATALGAGAAGLAGASGGNDSSSGGLLSFPAEIVGFFTGATDDLTSTIKWFETFFQPATYIRIGAGLAGIIFLIFAIVFLYKESGK